MPLTRYPLIGNPEIVIDVIGGAYRIATHEQNELIVDTRKTKNKALLPKVDVTEQRVLISEQPLLRWFTTREGVQGKIIIPERSLLRVKMYSGSIELNGHYGRLQLALRQGKVTLLGPYFAFDDDSSVKITTGEMRCVHLEENGISMCWSENKVSHLQNTSGATLRLQLGLVELDFS